MLQSLEISPEKLELLCHIPRFDQWIANANEVCLRHLSGAELFHLEDGDWVCHEGDERAFFIIVQGEIRIVKMEGEREHQFSTHKAGTFFGEIPITMETDFLVGGQSTGQSKVLRLNEDSFWSLFTSCPTIAKDISKTLARRLQRIESFSQTREKLVSLGTLAAGLAHELNNPAAAALRAVSQLRVSMAETELQALRLREIGFDVRKSHAMVALRNEFRPGLEPKQGKALSPMQRSDKEDEMTDWLESHGITYACHLAPSFVNAEVSVDRLGALVPELDKNEIVPVVSWLGGSLRSNDLIGEVERASLSISDLVKSVKSYSHLDSKRQEKVNLHEGLSSTLQMLRHKLRGIAVDVDFDFDLPEVCANGSEFNQVWTNLLDNAADVLQVDDKPKQGAHIGIKTGREGRCVFVEISDNGPGIPEEIQGRVFEPFFTTKKVGSGTGLGLDIVHRIIVERHGGEIICESNESGTKFHIRLPVERRQKERT